MSPTGDEWHNYSGWTGPSIKLSGVSNFKLFCAHHLNHIYQVFAMFIHCISLFCFYLYFSFIHPWGMM